MPPTGITVNEAKRLIAEGQRVVFLDARAPAAWEGSRVRIAGAKRVPLAEVDARLGDVPRDATVVPYCT